MARMPVLSTDTCFKNGSSFDICLAIYLVGQLGNLEPLIQLGKLLQLVLLQPYGIVDDKRQKGIFCTLLEARSAWPAFASLAPEGRTWLPGSPKIQLLELVQEIIGYTFLFNLQHSSDIGDQGRGVVLRNGIKLLASSLSEPHLEKI